MVNVRNFVILMSVCACLNTIFLGIIMIALHEISSKVERICDYTIDIFGMLRDIKFRCADFKDDNSNNLVELHRIENKLDDTSNNLRYLINNTVAIKKHTEKIEKNSAIK